VDSVFEKLKMMKIVPVVTIRDARDADALACVLLEGGLPCIEITFRTPAAQEAIRRMARHKDILVGAGTVLNLDRVKQVMDAGAQFIVSPGLNPKVVQFCLDQDIPVIPGVCTPTEIITALDLGLKTLKFFPAEAAGGIKILKAMSAPFNEVRFMPTGGITLQNLPDYLLTPQVIACGGTWLADTALLADKNFDRITDNIKQAVTLINTL
jgi:2-dehydro-3-deoxyphosphogluconate aldolase/(4S)-4-hydroxy-2-oxoglutarate aldolase